MITTVLDLERARLDTPGCSQVAHLNNAGAALMPSVVYDTVVAHLTAERSEGGYEAAERVVLQRRGVYESLARLLGAHADEIALTDSATRSWGLVFSAMRFSPGDRILTSVADYSSNFIAFLQLCRRTGVEIQVIGNDDSGAMSVSELEARLDERVRLVSVTHVPTDSGQINPAREIGAVVRQSSALYLLDACQSVGQMPIDVQDIGCDFLSGTGRKFLRGPRGTGFLYVDPTRTRDIEPLTADLMSATWTGPDSYDVRADARRFELWEHSVADQLGLGAAAQYALDMDPHLFWPRIVKLAATLRTGLASIRGVRVTDPVGPTCGIVTFTVDGWLPCDVVVELRRRGINTWHVEADAALLNMRARGLDAVVRASVHYYNDDSEVTRLCLAVEELASR